MSFHKLDRAKDKNFWSVRVKRRYPAHRAPERGQPAALLCRPPRRRLRLGGTAQARDVIPRPAPRSSSRSARRTEEMLIPHPRYPAADRPAQAAPVRRRCPTRAARLWRAAGMARRRSQANEDTILDLASTTCPQEAAEALLDLATGAKPRAARAAPRPLPTPSPTPTRSAASAWSRASEELARALDYPWEKWTVFLHPDQRQSGRRDLPGPARVSGSAGTGKTIVALHRAVHPRPREPATRGFC